MLSEKEKPLCSRQRFIVIFCFQNSQANIADAATIKALPAKDNSIGTANGHSNSATIAEAAACAWLPSSSARKAAKPPSPARIIPILPQIPYRRLSTNPAAYSSAITGNASRRTIHSTTMFYQFFDLFQCKHFVHLSAVRLRVN